VVLFVPRVNRLLRNLSITVGDDVAFCHSLNGVSGTSKSGAKVDMWWRATNCFRKIDGTWLVTHGHSSEPFDMKSGKALLDLRS
jgi:ketosteroid isomerase-like protein